MYVAKKDVKDAAQSRHICAGLETGLEAVIYAMYVVFQQDKTEAVLLVDADNVFNSINSSTILHNISITCRLITTFIANCYMEPARLSVVENHEKKIKRRCNTRKRNSNGSLCSRYQSFNHFLGDFIFINEHRSKVVEFADNFTVAEKASEIKAYWDILQQ